MNAVVFAHCSTSGQSSIIILSSCCLAHSFDWPLAVAYGLSSISIQRRAVARGEGVVSIVLVLMTPSSLIVSLPLGEPTPTDPL